MQRPAFVEETRDPALLRLAQPVYLPTPREANFLPDLDAIDEATWRRTALFYLCSPANPQGTMADGEYIERLLGLARRHDFVLIMDECYAEIYTDEAPLGEAVERHLSLDGPVTQWVQDPDRVEEEQSDQIEMRETPVDELETIKL